MGDFFGTAATGQVGQDGYNSVRITPKIIIKSPALAGNYDPQTNYRIIEIDPYNGVVMTIHTEWTGQTIETVNILSPSGMYSNGGQITMKNIPTDRQMCADGQLYRDGENLKIRVG
jgi:hypothetical protein